MKSNLTVRQRSDSVNEHFHSLKVFMRVSYSAGENNKKGTTLWRAAIITHSSSQKMGMSSGSFLPIFGNFLRKS